MESIPAIWWNVNTVVGEAIAAPDGSTVIPVSPRGLRLRGRRRGIQVRKTGGGSAVLRRRHGRGRQRFSPVGFIVVSGGQVRLLAGAGLRAGGPHHRNGSGSCSRRSKAPCKAAPAKRRSRPRARAEGAVASARIASNRRAPRVLKFLSARIVCPVRRGGSAAPGGGEAMQFLGEALVWAAENLWALILHITGRSSFPKPLTAAEEAGIHPPYGRRRPARPRDALIEHNLRLVAHIAQKISRRRARRRRYGFHRRHRPDQGCQPPSGPEAGKLTTYASRCIENEILMQLRASRRSRLTVQLDDPIGTDKEGNEVRLTDLLGTDKDGGQRRRRDRHRIHPRSAPAANGTARRSGAARPSNALRPARRHAPRAARGRQSAGHLAFLRIAQSKKKALEKLRGALGG